MVDSSEKVNVEKLTELQLDTIDRIIKVFPNVEFSPTIHELLWHSGQCIGKCQIIIRIMRQGRSVILRHPAAIIMPLITNYFLSLISN